MIKDLECIYCDTKFSVEIFDNYDVICPCCKRSIFSECEYGYGPVTPCRIYLGPEIVGMVESEGANYYLNMNSEKIPLNNTYMKAIPEAVGIVRSELGLILPQEDIEITAKGGSLCFYGDWFGRPYDNYHQIIHTSYDGEILNLIFKGGEQLLVYEPENITSSKKELKIAKARKLKWIYTPYGTIQRNIITYTWEGDTLIKTSKYGIQHLKMKEPHVAVYMASY